MKKVYFDSAATTELRSEVIHCIAEVLRTEYGNPSSTHSYGRSSKSLLETARKEIAGYLNVSPGEIVFTSGGTEADNLVINSAVRDLHVKRIISSKTEHHAVLHTIGALEKEYGIRLEWVDLDSSGLVDTNHLESLLKSSSEKTLVSLMHVNNEIGAMIDLKEIADLCVQYHALFHSDTVQSIGHFKLDFDKIKIDFAAAAAHKFHGPKGVGFAFVRKNTGLRPLIHGGEQERGLRAGTEAVYAIAGMAEALRISYLNLEKEKHYISELKRYFIDQLRAHIPGVAFNGPCEDFDRSTYTLLNVRLPISEEKATLLLFQLDLKGIACSKGSACQSGSTSRSHVLEALLTEEDLQQPSIRFSFSSFNSRDEVDYVIEILKEIVLS